MDIQPQAIADVLLITPKVHGDDRGYFFESHREDKLSEACKSPVVFVQGNQSSSRRGILRGLHFQSPPRAQAKLVRVLYGEILDVAVDIRHGSPSYGRYVCARLDSLAMQQLFVPRGFAHGFVVLSENAIVSYLIDEYYSPEHNQGIVYNDSQLDIDWQIDEQSIVVNNRDANWSALNQQPEWFAYES